MTHVELARLCQQIYTPGGIPEADEIGGMGPLCSVVPGMCGRPTVVVFRGTSDFAAWAQDFDCRWGVSAHGPVHDGFLRCWDVIRNRKEADEQARKLLPGD